MKKFEYQNRPLLDVPPDAMSKAFADLGSEGWELTSVSGGVAYFKREKEELPEVMKEEPAPPPMPEKNCGGCTNFSSMGPLSKKTGLMPGFCELHRWSTNHKNDCEKYEPRKTTSV